MMSYLPATESKTPRTREAFCDSSTVSKPKWVSLMRASYSGLRFKETPGRPKFP